MKAVVKTTAGFDNMTLKTIAEPEATGSLVKIKVAYSGICGSDIHTFKGEYANSKTPVVLGHEFSGIVSAVGADVTRFKVGDRVTSETTFATCGKCRYCQSKDYNLCSKRVGIGTQVDGSMAEYVLSREESCHLLPAEVSLQAAALTEPLACCVHAVMEKTTIEKGDTVLVIGPGPIGLLVAQVALFNGATVIMSGITKDTPRLQLALQLGVSQVVDTQIEKLEDVVMAATGGEGVAHLFDCSGVIQAVNQGLPLVAKKGIVIQVGIFANDLNAMDQNILIQRELTYIGSRSQKPSSWKKAIELLEQGGIDVERMITKEVELDHWRDGFDVVMGGNEIKVLIASDNALV